jgi:hypothetical protein
MQSLAKLSPMLQKQHGKKRGMILYYTQAHSESTIFWISPLVDSKDGIDFAMLFTLRASLSATTQQVGKTGGGLPRTPWALKLKADP